MARELRPIRVKPLLPSVGSSDPAEHMLSLIEAGCDRFYVRVPIGFQCNFTGAPFWIESRIRDDRAVAPSLIRNSPEPSYLQLDKTQLQELLINESVTLSRFDKGALFLRLTSGGMPSLDFDHQQIWAGRLEPKNRAIADATPISLAPGQCMVVKSPIAGSSMHSYSLHGVGFRSIFVEEEVSGAATAEDLSLDGRGIALADAGGPTDPYRLAETSPLVFAILTQAYNNRGRARADINTDQIKLALKENNCRYANNPKPFKSKGGALGVNLANPYYRYKAGKLRPGAPLPVTAEMPADDFFRQDFINSELAKVLYAACCWSGAKGPMVDGDREKLVDLLVALGFWDADDEDMVQSLVFFVTGTKYDRGVSYFRHTRGERILTSSQEEKEKGR